jgi:hypothetical protein
MEYKSQDYNPHSFKVKESQDDFLLEQDIQAYKDFATESRQINEQFGGGKHYRSFAIIPDIVAIDILTKYQIDIHSADFMSNPALIRRVKEIIKTEYPALLTGSMINSKTYY